MLQISVLKNTSTCHKFSDIFQMPSSWVCLLFQNKFPRPQEVGSSLNFGLSSSSTNVNSSTASLKNWKCDYIREDYSTLSKSFFSEYKKTNHKIDKTHYKADGRSVEIITGLLGNASSVFVRCYRVV